jgi:hypothetical protein
MVLCLVFAFWSTWQMREQTWHICQAAHGVAKGRSRASLGPPRNPDFLRAIYGPSITSNTIAVVRCRTREGLHCDRKPRASPATSLIRVVAAAPATSGGQQKELAARPMRKTREPAATLRAQRKVAREDDREHARRKKIASRSTLANCQLNYAKPLEMTYF